MISLLFWTNWILCASDIRLGSKGKKIEMILHCSIFATIRAVNRPYLYWQSDDDEINWFCVQINQNDQRLQDDMFLCFVRANLVAAIHFVFESVFFHVAANKIQINPLNWWFPFVANEVHKSRCNFNAPINWLSINE